MTWTLYYLLAKQHSAKRPRGRAPHSATSSPLPYFRRPQIEHLEDRQLLSINWNGSGDGYSWEDPLNWVGNQVPGANDDVQIDIPGETAIVVSADTTVRRLRSVEPVTLLHGTLSVTGGDSRIDNALVLNPGTALTVAGSGTSFTATGSSSIDGASLLASGGATLALPNVTSYANDNSHSKFQAIDDGSVLELPGLTSLNAIGELLDIIASSGGLVNLAHLSNISDSYISIIAEGVGHDSSPSTVDFSALATFSNTSENRAFLAVNEGGRIINPLLTNTSNVGWSIGFSFPYYSIPSQIHTSQLTSLTGGGIGTNQPLDLSGLTSLNNAILYVAGSISFSLPNLVHVDGSSLAADYGAKLSLPNVTSYTKGNSAASFRASNTGSFLDLPALTSLSDIGGGLDVEVWNGGRLNLSSLVSITNSPIQFNALGSGFDDEPATIDLSSLSTFNNTAGTLAYLMVSDGGRIIDPLLTSTNGVGWMIGRNGHYAPCEISTSQLTSVTEGSLTIYEPIDLSSLTNIDNSSLNVSNGVTLSLSNITAYSMGSGFGAYFTATGDDSVLDLPVLTNLTSDYGSLLIDARDGGRINLPQLSSIGGNQVRIQAVGVGTGNAPSTIDLSTLVSFNNYAGPWNSLGVSYGGCIITPLLTETVGVEWFIGPNGAEIANQIDIGQLTRIIDGSLRTYQQLDLPALTNIDGSNLYAYSGGILSLPNVTSYTKGRYPATFLASGAGSILDLPGLTDLTSIPYKLTIKALAGGLVNLSSLASIVDSYLQIIADGVGTGNLPSMVDLYGLDTFIDSANSHSELSATNGGQILNHLWTTLPPGHVVGRFVFYNNSAFDGNDPSITPNDDAAIATDKTAYVRGSGAATFDSVTSYSKGINGIMIDIAGPHTGITAADFIFGIGGTTAANANYPFLWPLVTATPTISVRAGAGVGGSDRIVITWPDNAIRGAWLEVAIKANAHTGLAQLAGAQNGIADIFFWGNAPGDSGTGDAMAFVTNVSDENAARSNPASLASNISITNPFDYNRDRKVDVSDQTLARLFANSSLTAPRRIDISPWGPILPTAAAFAVTTADNAVASALAATSNTKSPAKALPKDWVANVLSRMDLHASIVATLFQQLAVSNQSVAKQNLVNVDDQAIAQELDDALLNELVVGRHVA